LAGQGASTVAADLASFAGVVAGTTVRAVSFQVHAGVPTGRRRRARAGVDTVALLTTFSALAGVATLAAMSTVNLDVHALVGALRKVC
jgi:hypothetical protein